MASLRKPFLETLTKFAEQDKKVIFMVGDVGFSFVEQYKTRFPNQFINCGIAEQNMMGMAAGLANVGWKPYVYTMKNFVLCRPYEQVRNDIAFANKNVKLFGVGGSEAYRFLGMSHNLFDGEEERLLENLPNVESYFPESERELIGLMMTEFNREGPAYFAI